MQRSKDAFILATVCPKERDSGQRPDGVCAASEESFVAIHFVSASLANQQKQQQQQPFSDEGTSLPASQEFRVKGGGRGYMYIVT